MEKNRDAGVSWSLLGRCEFQRVPVSLQDPLECEGMKGASSLMWGPHKDTRINLSGG